MQQTAAIDHQQSLLLSERDRAVTSLKLSFSRPNQMRG
jgi:hypothetical protein